MEGDGCFFAAIFAVKETGVKSSTRTQGFLFFEVLSTSGPFKGRTIFLERFFIILMSTPGLTGFWGEGVLFETGKSSDNLPAVMVVQRIGAHFSSE
jgi:hypothetical protein